MDNQHQRRLAQSTPFYYGWVVLAVAALPSYSSRAVMSATTLSVFVVPMTDEFGWSRGLFSGALSLGGLCAVAISPIAGRLIDRHGSGVMLAVTAALIGSFAVGLSVISQSWMFYSLYVPGRMLFASPQELGTATAVSNWFIRRRPLALALLGATQGTGLAAMPPIVQIIISGWDWRVAWASIGVFTISVGVIPYLLMMVRRPEDVGLEADPSPPRPPHVAGRLGGSGTGRSSAISENDFSVHEALRTRAFWVLAAFSAAGFVAQGGVSMHLVPHYINEGLAPAKAVAMASSFALSMVLGGFLWSSLSRWVPIRFLLAMAGLSIALGAAGAGASSTLLWGIVAASVFGAGIGSLHLMLRLVWADYYGRRNLGSIRGLTLPFQLGGQAVGPIISGFIFDATDSYRMTFIGLGAVVALAAVMVLAATPPRKEPGRG